jgi:hypothetical protein
MAVSEDVDADLVESRHDRQLLPMFTTILNGHVST